MKARSGKPTPITRFSTQAGACSPIQSPQKKNPPGGRKTKSQIHLLGGRSPASFTITMMSNARASCAIGISSAKRTHACAEDHG